MCTPLLPKMHTPRPFVKRCYGRKCKKICGNRFRSTAEPYIVKKYRKSLVNQGLYKKKLDTNHDTHCIKIGVQLWCRWWDSRRHWGSAAASPGNSETVHWTVPAPRGDVPFEPHPRCSRQKDKPVLSHRLIFLVPVVGLEIGHRHRPACAPRRTVRPDTISRPLKSRHRRDFPLRVAASSPSFTITKKNTPIRGYQSVKKPQG